MIHDAGDGGRSVWKVTGLTATPLHVIAANAANALAWARRATEAGGVAVATNVPTVAATFAGSADRTEIALWGDETRLASDDGGDPPGGSAP